MRLTPTSAQGQRLGHIQALGPVGPLTMLGKPRSLVMGLHDKQEVMSPLWVDGGDMPGLQGAWVLTTAGSPGVVQVE